MRERYRLFEVLVAVMIVAAGTVSAGCIRVGDEDGEHPGPESSGTGVADTGVAEGEVPSGAEPPEGTITLGDNTRIGELGSYCWGPISGTSEGVAVCADAAGIPLPPEDQALTVPRGWVLVFDYGGSGQPASVSAAAYPLGRCNVPRGPPGGRFLPPTEGRPGLEAENLQVSRLGDRAQIPVGLPEGEYVVEVSIRVPEGDAAYYFRVVMV